MGDKAFVRVVTRTSSQLRSRLKKLVADVGVARGREIDQEAFIAASWLWMETLDVEELAERIAPFVATAEVALTGKKPDAIEGYGSPDAEKPAGKSDGNPKRKRGAG